MQRPQRGVLNPLLELRKLPSGDRCVGLVRHPAAVPEVVKGGFDPRRLPARWIAVVAWICHGNAL